MSELEYSLKEVIEDTRATVKDIERTVNSMNNSLGNDYQKKSDCEACKNELNDRINVANSWIIGLYGLIIASIGVLVAVK